jgi:hypothetical protein
MSLWSSILDVLKTMSTIAGSVITYLFITVPTLGGAVIAFLGVLLGQYLTHLYTQRRENKKLLREKAEDLIRTLCQIQHSVFIWHDGLIRDARLSNESWAVDAVRDIEQFGRQRLPEPTEYRAVGHAILLDHQRADTIQRLYFPSIERSYEAYVDALIPLLILFDHQRADTIQRLYFPSIERSYEAYVDALIPLLAWAGRPQAAPRRGRRTLAGAVSCGDDGALAAAA